MKKVNLTEKQIGIIYMLISEAEPELKYTNEIHNELVDLKIQFDSIAKSLT